MRIWGERRSGAIEGARFIKVLERAYGCVVGAGAGRFGFAGGCEAKTMWVTPGVE